MSTRQQAEAAANQVARTARKGDQIMLTFDAFNHLVTGLADVHRRRRTERLIESLPFDTRKDIGWRNGSQHRSPATDPWR